MQVFTEQRGTLHRLCLEGDLDIYTAADLKTALVHALSTTHELEIDLAQISAIDTSGIQLLAAAKREALGTGKTMRMVNHSAAVVELIELYDLAGWFGDPLLLPHATHDGGTA